MSTDKRKKRRLPRIDRIKILEYGCIGLVIALFVGLAILYDGKQVKTIPTDPDNVPSPVPTDDHSIRGKNVLDAIDDSSFLMDYREGVYTLTSENGVVIEMRMQSDDTGLQRLFFETSLYSDPETEGYIADTVRAQNKNTVEALRDLFDCIMPALHRNASDSDTVVKHCTKVVQSGEPYSSHIGQFTVRIRSDRDSTPETVAIEWIRDP